MSDFTPPTSLGALAAALAEHAGIQIPTTPPAELPITRRRRERPRSAFATDAADRMRAAVAPAFRDCLSVSVAGPRLRFPVADVVRAARGVFDGAILRVVFRGQSADGKTSGAALLVGELARLVEAHFATERLDPAGRSLRWWEGSMAWCSAHDLAAEADHNDLDQEIARRAGIASILVLDDLGNEKGRFPGSNNVPPGILQARYDAAQITVVTSGLTRDELAARYSINLARRMRDAKDPRTVVLGAKAVST